MSYQVTISPQAINALVDVRGTHESITSLMKAVSLPLPETAHSQLSQDGVDVMRVGPKRCLVRADIDAESDLIQRLRSQSDALYANATLISDMYTPIQVSGSDATEVLCQVTSLNLNEFEVGAATATEVFSTAGFLVHEAEREYTLYVESSFADWCLERMQKCALVMGA
jgi:heterotetrameric sarcosine oxidase gamma subunit